MSASMIKLRDALAERLGAGYGRIVLVQMCQQRGLTPLDEATDDLKRAVYGRA